MNFLPFDIKMEIVHETELGKFFSRPVERRFAMLVGNTIYMMYDYKLDLAVVKHLKNEEIPRVFEQPPKIVESDGGSIRVIIEYKGNRVIINLAKCGTIGDD